MVRRALLLALTLALPAACGSTREAGDGPPRGDLTLYWERAPREARVSVRPKGQRVRTRPVLAGRVSFPGLPPGPVEILARPSLRYSARSMGWVRIEDRRETLVDLGALHGAPSSQLQGRFGAGFGRFPVRPVPFPELAVSR